MPKTFTLLTQTRNSDIWESLKSKSLHVLGDFYTPTSDIADGRYVEMRYTGSLNIVTKVDASYMVTVQEVYYDGDGNAWLCTQATEQQTACAS